MLSRASFEGIARPSTLHFIKHHSYYRPFAVAAEDDADSVAALSGGYYRRPWVMFSRLARASPAPLDAALAPLADCVTELLIDLGECRGQEFCYGFGALRNLRRLAVRVARPGISPSLPLQLDLAVFSQAHGARLTSLDVSGSVRQRISSSRFAALRRLVVRGIRSPRSKTLAPFRLPSQRGNFPELEFLAAGFEGHRPARLQFSDRDWFARYCALQSRQAQGECYFWCAFSSKFSKVFPSLTWPARPPAPPPQKKTFF